MIAATLADGTGIRQRPRLGLALLDTSPGLTGPIRLLDASGDDLWHVELSSREGWSLIEQPRNDG